MENAGLGCLASRRESVGSGARAAMGRVVRRCRRQLDVDVIGVADKHSTGSSAHQLTTARKGRAEEHGGAASTVATASSSWPVSAAVG